MKKLILKLLFLFFIVFVTYVVYEELSFSPLNKEDMGRVFQDFDGKLTKICDKNFLGLSMHGEYFEIYRYKLGDGEINNNYPNLDCWERKQITDEVIVPKWRKAPLDETSEDMFKFILTVEDFDQYSCSESFNKKIVDPENYYSYIYFSEYELYFLLYSPEDKELYYIRKNGF